MKRVVLITGAARGIGAACVKRFAHEGCHVVGVDLIEDELRQLFESIDPGKKAHFYKAFDVAERENVFDFVNEAINRFGKIDVLVNNAGISPKHNGKKALIEEMAWEEWKRVVDVNLHAIFHFTQAVVPSMKKNRYGKIINISSRAARTYVDIPAIHYGTTKTAVVGFTRYAAGELREYGINVNSVAPGRIETPLMRQTAVEDVDAEAKHYPIGFGKPEDIANIVSFLASDEAWFINGAVIDANGGRTMA